MSRARTVGAGVQPLEQEWNPAGYLWNVVPRVTVQAASPQSYRSINVATPTSYSPSTSWTGFGTLPISQLPQGRQMIVSLRILF
jgi:hypothetical protein